MATERNLQVLQTVAALIDEHGWSPSLEEIGDVLGIRSKASVARHLDQLEADGLIFRGTGFRQIRLTTAGVLHMKSRYDWDEDPRAGWE